jgi:tricorn protease
MSKRLLPILVPVLCALSSLAQSGKPLLARHPTMSQTQLVFSYGGELWSAPRAGGDAHPLTTGPGIKTGPIFSPDGRWIAFTESTESNVDVYVIPAEGGVPRRLTFHPGIDTAIGWTPDGKQVLFSSYRNSYENFPRLFTAPLEGGFPAQVPLPEAVEGSYSPDGKQLAYVPVTTWSARTAWKRYRGGQAARVWIAALADSSIVKLPREDSNDFNPLWIGDRIYFLSDRNGPVSLFAFDRGNGKVEEVLHADTDIKYAGAGPGVIVYEQLGSLHTFDPASGKSAELSVNVAADLPGLRPHFEKVGDRIENFNLSPTGQRAVFEAHGEILTVPADKGDIRDLTRTPGAAERDPAWSPDGKWIAYFSEQSGEYALYLRAQDGMGEPRKIDLGTPPSYFYSPVWSPDSKRILYHDKRWNLWYLDVASPKPVLVDTDYYEAPFHALDPAWSPDSRWITYTRQLPSHMRAVFVYSLETGKSAQITDGMSDARYPVFDKDGKYLYFTTSTNAGPTEGWLDLSSFGRAVTRSVYVAVLRKDLPSPLAPQSDEEKIAEAKPEAEQAEPASPANGKEEPAGKKEGEKKPAKKPVLVQIDFEGISQRILALPIPTRNFTGMFAGEPGTLFLLESAPLPIDRRDFGLQALDRFELGPRRFSKLLEGVNDFALSSDSKKLLYGMGEGRAEKWFIASAPPPSPAGGPAPEAPPRVSGQMLKLEGMEVWVDPRAEWQQEYREVWRIERDFFYAPNLHGVDWQKAEKYYQPFIDALSSRQDLDYVFNDMLGELTIGHMFISAPPPPVSDQPAAGLLGAEYAIENGRYRFAKVYQGENWNPDLRAPLTGPGVNVAAGEYLLAVNGRELTASDNLFAFFQGTAGKQTVLKVGPDPAGKGAREVTVVPIPAERTLRLRDWMDSNRRRVDELSGGKVAYVYFPDTAAGGYSNLNRYYFAQVGKQAAVLDERFNHGGAAADYIIEALRLRLDNYWFTREGHTFTTPQGAIFGPKVMITNMYAGSGGDALPWYFRHERIGKLIGTRTWGGLVGIYDYPVLMDGGRVTAPRVAFYNPDGQWDVENHGVAPDIEVDYSPQAWRQGHDPQLEKAVEVVLEELKAQPPTTVPPPAFPDYHPGGWPK